MTADTIGTILLILAVIVALWRIILIWQENTINGFNATLDDGDEGAEWGAEIDRG